MAISPSARTHAAAQADAYVRAQKRTYAERLRRIQAAATPALTNAELSLGLDLDEREVGRFVSDSPRMATARPDGELRALIDAVLEGAIAVAVRAGAPGERREVLVLTPGEARRLDRAWTVLPFADVGLRTFELDDDALWNLGAGSSASTRAPPSPPAGATPRATGPVDRLRLLDRDVFPIVLGTLRLGTAGRPSEADARALLHAALDAGVDVLDTADSYGLDEDDRGYAERLIARLGRPAIVVTKAGLARPGGRWVPDGSPARLRSGCEQSLRNLGVDALDLLLLHAVDPRVPLAESVGTLATLREEGKVRAIGLSNVTAAQLDEARAIAPVAAVQVEISRFTLKDLALAVRCAELGIPVLAHRPLGGHARAGKAPDAALVDVAATLGASPQRVALAWLLAAGVLPVVGATRRASLLDSLAAASLSLDADALARLDRGLPPRPVRTRDEMKPVDPGEILLLVGPPAAGKTSRVEPYLAAGYARLNRDELGGRLDGLVPRLREGLAAGKRRWVLDNTYATRASRKPVLDAARAAGVPVRCLHLETPLGEALYNASLRFLQRYGRLPEPTELAKPALANDVPPQAITGWFQQFEAPDPSEGIATIERVPFARAPGGQQRALLLDLDGTVRVTRSGAPFPRHPDDVVLLPGRRALLTRLHGDGWLLLGVSNQAGVAMGQVDRAAVEACFARTEELLGLPLPVRYCPHPAGTIRCWCRKPMPGMGVAWIEERGLDRAACIMVGDRASDQAFAENLGVRFSWAKDFFLGE